MIDRFAAMSADELNDYFRTTDVLEITEVIRSADDADLRRLIELEHFRAAGVVAILDRFAEFADAERLGEIQGVVRFELARSKKDDECHTVRFQDGTVAIDSEAQPDVVIAADILDFVRLVTGESNAALLYLGARLGIEGHEMLALAVGTVFTVPGSDQKAVDPTALDPVDVATAVATTSAKHMRSVMEGGFRPIVLEEVFRRFPEFIDADKAGDLSSRSGSGSVAVATARSTATPYTSRTGSARSRPARPRASVATRRSPSKEPTSCAWPPVSSTPCAACSPEP